MKRFLPLIIIICVGFLVRVVGLNYGLPFLYHDDEPLIVNCAVSYATGNFTPVMFYVPPLLSYLLFFAYGLFYLIGLLLGIFNNVNDFGYLFLNNPTAFYLIGRFIYGVIPGTLSVLFLYRLGKKVFDNRVGLIAAFFLAVNFLHARDSHYIYFDIPLIMFLVILFSRSVDLIRNNSTRNYIWTGVLIGVVTGIKYFGPPLIPFLASVLVHNLIFYRKEGLVNIKKIALLVFFSVVTFFILNPFAFLQYERFLRTFTKILFGPQALWFHLQVSLIGSVGLFMLCSGLIGSCIAVVKKNRVAWLLSIFIFSYYLIIVFKSQGAERYVMPLVPVVLLFAAYFTRSIAGYLKRLLSEKLILVSISCLLVLPSTYKIFLADRLFLRTDTRTEAYRWIKENIPADSVIAMDATNSWFPKLEKSREQIEELYDGSQKTSFKPLNQALDFKKQLMLSNPGYSSTTYFIYYMREKKIRGFHSIYPDMLVDFDELVRKKAEYVIVSNILIEGKYDEFIKKLKEDSRLLKSFSPYPDGVASIKPEEDTALPAAAFSMRELKRRRSFGPHIEVYRIEY